MSLLMNQLTNKFPNRIWPGRIPTAIIVVLFSLLLSACETSTSPLPLSSETQTPEVLSPTAIPTREGTPNLDGEHISLYFLCGQSGPFAELNLTKIMAARDMVSYINENGGIFGAQIDLQVADTGGIAEVAISAYERISRLDQDIPLVLLCDAESENALAESLQADSLPALGPGLADRAYFEGENKRLYAFNVAVDQHFALWIDYLVGHWDDIKPLGAGDEIRLALISEQTGGSELSGNLAALTYAEGLGVEIVDQIPVSASPNPNLYDAVYRARDVNANVIYIQSHSPSTAELLNALNALGLRERVIVSGPSHTFEASLLPYLLVSSNASGTYQTISTTWWSDGDNPAIKLAAEIFNSNSRLEESKDSAYLITLGAVDIALHAFEEAIFSVGYENLDAEALNASLSQLTDYRVLHGLFVVNYSSGNHLLDSLQVMIMGDNPANLTSIQDFAVAPYLDFEVEE